MSDPRWFSRVRNRVPRHWRVRISRTMLDRQFGAVYAFVRPGFSKMPAGATLVIDGYPRSANSFSMTGLGLLLPEQRLFGHTHSVHTLAVAVRRGIPTILLLRDPDEAVSSYSQMVDGMTLKFAYNSYARFHKSLERLKHEILIVSFATATRDLARVVPEVESRFGVELGQPRLVEDLDSLVFAELEETNRRLNNGVLREAGVARKSASRKRPAEILAGMDQATREARARAQEVYARLNSSAV